MSKLNMFDLCGVLVSKNGLEDKEAQRFVKAMFDIIQEGLDEDKIVKVKGLGTFKIIEVDSRESINVNTGERVLIDGHSKLTFTPDSVMKEIVNKPFSQFETVVLNDGVDFPETKVEEEMGNEVEEALAEAAPAVETKAAPAVEAKAAPAVDIVAAPESEGQNKDGEDKPEPVVAKKEEQDVPAEAENQVKNIVEEPKEESGEVIMYDDEQEGKSMLRIVISCIVVILLVLASAYGGYLYGRYDYAEEMAHKQLMEDLRAAEVTAREATAVIKNDTLEQEVDATKIGAISTEKIKEEAKEEVKEETKEKTPKADTPKTETETASDDYKKYEQKDPRVRTGAYRIVGLDRTVKAKEGQTVESVANRCLGSGMSCYVEVYNDLKGNTVLKEGQTIKIPKLQLKKKRR